MKKILIVIIIAFLFGSNLYQFVANDVINSELALYKEWKEEEVAVRNILIETFSSLKTDITKQELIKVLKNNFPNEKIEISDELVSCKFIHFWFKDGKLNEIQYGS